MSNSRWWESAVFYQIYPRSFADGNGDGIGDFQGMISKLDYLSSLGIDAVWLSPHYPSPQLDVGYDIADYTAVNPEYGTLEEFKAFLQGLHERGIKLILGAIIISFAFFFGYSRMSRSRRGIAGLAPGQPVAIVNGAEISDTDFSFFYDRNMDRLEQTIKEGAINESMRKFAQSMTLQQLIQRQLLLQTAHEAGIQISDQELASTIRKNQIIRLFFLSTEDTISRTCFIS